MAYELREGQGSLFRNDKEGVESRPDYRGDIMINGVAYRLSAWIKEGRNGKFMSLAAQPKEDRKTPGPAVKNDYAAASQSSTRDSMKAQAPTDFDDDTPF